MKIHRSHLSALCGFIIACSGPQSSMEPDPVPLRAGDEKAFVAGDVSIDMHYVPGKIFFKTPTDGTIDTISESFWIAEIEVTWKLWDTVYQWAAHGVGGAVGEGDYAFAEGWKGSASGAGDTLHPVSRTNWRDNMVFCNALTEYYNANNGTASDLECVYYADGVFTNPVRACNDTTLITWEAGTGQNDGSQDDPFVKPDADGFRLPYSDEWELAARYIADRNNDSDITDSAEYYPGNFASGADDAYNAVTALSDIDGDGDQDISSDVAWFTDNSGSCTHEPGSIGHANALGLFDMSGNMYERCFDWYSGYEGSSRIRRGGSWSYGNLQLRVGNEGGDDAPYYRANSFVGLRLVKSAP